jgi:tetratricopeptide (TPR) repeat protein
MTKRHFSLVIFTALAAVLVLIPLGLAAEDFEGANGLLEKLKSADSSSAGASATAASSPDSVTQFATDLASFTARSPGLSPDKAATGWIALFDRSLTLEAGDNPMSQFSSATRAVFSALPGPATWPLLDKLIRNGGPAAQKPRSNVALHLILDTLENAEDRQWPDLSILAARPPGGLAGLSFSGRQGDPILNLGANLSEVTNQPDQVEKFWDAALTRAAQLNQSQATADSGDINLPDLVTILGPVRAEPLILRALLLPFNRVGEVQGLATQALARKLALAHIDQLRLPPWSLTKSLDSADLYEALNKKFPNDDGGRESAIYYVVALVTHGRAAEAIQADHDVDSSQLEEVTEQLAEAGWGPQVYDYVHAYLAQHPESDLWKFYIDLASQTGHANEALKFVQETSARADLSPAARERVRPVLYRGLLAVDRVDEGIAELRALIRSEKGAPASPAPGSLSSLLANVSQAATRRFMARQMETMEDDPVLKTVTWGLELAHVGRLLKKDDLENEGLGDAMQAIGNIPAAGPNDSSLSAATAARDQVWTYEMETGRYPQAEKLIIDALVEAHQKVKNAQSQRGLIAGLTGTTAYDYQSRELMGKLALVYYEAGRWSDVVVLLEQVPGWGVKDLAQVAGEGAYLDRRSTPHLDLMAARALAETGRTDEALTVVDYTLREDSGNDAAYALLLKIGQGDLVAKLDALYRQDQFQERPLIWKAVVLLRQGRVAEAEAACKAAIAVDPSDGEEGKGDRMRVYSVMADVCDAEKQPQQATFFRNVVKAIRLSEDADDFYDAGLLTRAVAMYAQALDLFSDAYCIQSRLARQLAELGRTEEAAVHYRKAFELMPVSFGRLESHCFGCERAFQGKTAASIAEETFTQMMAKDPRKPQLPYLLGYLYMEEKRFPEALANFEKAAQLDPDYINAWRHIAEIGEDYQLDPALRDNAVFNLLRLDPGGRHVSPRTDNVRQLDKLWAAEEAADKAVPPLPDTLFTLQASAALVPPGADPRNPFSVRSIPGLTTEAQSWMQLQQLGIQVGQEFYRRSGEPNSPRNAVLGNKVISGALDLLAR